MKNFFLLICFFPAVCSLSQQVNRAQYVDPMIGTGGHGHTFPGATTPFGMVQLSPDTRIDGSWDGCSGYHYSDSVIYGFSHTHLSGTGCSDYGDIMLMPVMGEPSVDNKKYSSKFYHQNETAGAGYYSVRLDNDDINVELTATTRVGLHRYTFNKNGNAHIILDLTHRDKALPGTYLKITGNNKIEGCRVSKAWAQQQIVYFTAEFSEPFDWEIFLHDKSMKGHPLKDNYYSGENVKAVFSFKNSKSSTIMVKVALSGVGTDGAWKNLEAELPGWDFEKVRKEAESSWNKELSKIEITDNDPEKLKIFYTALYHAMIQPNIYNDADHRYRGRDNKIHTAEGFDYYTVFSLWDTFRAAHPLYTIIDQKRTSDFINTFIAEYGQGGRLPVWELSSNETDCMIGYHAVSVIADAMVKGIKGFDYEKAYQASRHSAMLDIFGLKPYKEKGFISSEDENESVSRTLEYAYDDWCIAQMARLLKKDSDFIYFSHRAQGWKNIFNPAGGFMCARKNGGWFSPFDPKEVNNNFTEGNSWQYTFFVPQDIYGLIERMGGSEKFEKKLDELFTASSQTSGRDQPDISGLIGQYAHGNEPSHHMAYLYNYVGRPAKAQERVRQILTGFYKTGPDGLIGNEDCGQMSAWYILSALGVYQVCPGSQQFVVGSPVFKKALVHLEGGKTLSIETENNSVKNLYIRESSFNKINHDMAYCYYADLVNGGVFNFVMSDMPEDPDIHSWGRPLPFYVPEEIIPAPVISGEPQVFDDSTEIKISSLTNDSIFFLHEIPQVFVGTLSWMLYQKPEKTFCEIKISACCKRGPNKSSVIEANFYKRPNNWKIELFQKYSPQYAAGGDQGIIDGLQGTTDWRKGGWQGYEGKNMEAVIDLRKERNVSQFTAGFLQDEGAWILMPKKVEYYISEDGKNFTLVSTADNTIEDTDQKVQVKKFISGIKSPVKTRYVKVIAYNYGKLPQWHEGAGKDAWLFIDEINIE